MPSDVTFEPLSKAHRNLLVDWTAQPHVLEWWSDAAESVDAFFEADDTCWPFIASVDKQPTAYIQSWQPTRGEEYPWQKELPLEARGIDLFIGPPERLNLGYGPRIISAFAAKLFAEGAPKICIDPNVKNSRAIRAYEKAGFRPIGEVKDIDGTNLLMELTP